MHQWHPLSIMVDWEREWEMVTTMQVKIQFKKMMQRRNCNKHTNAHAHTNASIKIPHFACELPISFSLAGVTYIYIDNSIFCESENQANELTSICIFYTICVLSICETGKCFYMHFQHHISYGKCKQFSFWIGKYGI